MYLEVRISGFKFRFHPLGRWPDVDNYLNLPVSASLPVKLYNYSMLLDDVKRFKWNYIYGLEQCLCMWVNYCSYFSYHPTHTKHSVNTVCCVVAILLTQMPSHSLLLCLVYSPCGVWCLTLGLSPYHFTHLVSMLWWYWSLLRLLILIFLKHLNSGVSMNSLNTMYYLYLY